MAKYQTSNGWTVETIRLSLVPQPRRPGDPGSDLRPGEKRDGPYFLVKNHGKQFSFLRIRPVEGKPHLLDLTELGKIINLADMTQIS